MSNMEKTVTRIMQSFSVEYRDFIGDNSHRIALWCNRLKGIEPESVYKAAMALIDSGHDFPPNIGKVKNKAILIENKHLGVSASTAWGRILLKIKNKEFKLTELEKKALACTCDLYTLRTMKATDLSYERNFFIKHYEELRNIETQKVIAIKQDNNLLESDNTKRIEG